MRGLRRRATIGAMNASHLQPVEVATEVEAPVGDVYEHLLTLANHERFTDHMLVDWRLEGPRSGVGARAVARSRGMGPSEEARFEIVDAQAPRRIVEHSTAAGGRRVMAGEYRLAPLAPGRTSVRFHLEYVRAPRADRLLWPLLRRRVTRLNQRAMDRLAALFPAEQEA